MGGGDITLEPTHIGSTYYITVGGNYSHRELFYPHYITPGWYKFKLASFDLDSDALNWIENHKQKNPLLYQELDQIETFLEIMRSSDQSAQVEAKFDWDLIKSPLFLIRLSKVIPKIPEHLDHHQ